MVVARTESETGSRYLSQVARPLLSALLAPHRVLGRLAIIPRGTSQSVPVSCAHLVSFSSADFGCGLVGACLGAYVDQWDHITSNVFVRNIVQTGYGLEFAQDNAPPLSRAPIVFKSIQGHSGHGLFSEAISKLLEKGVIGMIDRQASTADFFPSSSRTTVIDRSSTCLI